MLLKATSSTACKVSCGSPMGSAGAKFVWLNIFLGFKFVLSHFAFIVDPPAFKSARLKSFSSEASY